MYHKVGASSVALIVIVLNILCPCRCDNNINGSNATTNLPNSLNRKQVSHNGHHVHDGSPPDQIPLVRLPSNTLLKYTAYKDVSILHFRIPTDTRSAFFSFKAYEESKSAFPRVCQPQDVTLHLKAGSYPVISPENITFPKHFLSADQRFEIHSLQFKSDGVTRRLNIDGPHPGNWFAVAFISYTDPNNDRIEQQGLAASCETLFLSEMSVVHSYPRIVGAGPEYKDTLISNATEPISYKFFVPRNTDICTFKLTIAKACMECSDITFYVQSHSLPNSKNYVHSVVISANQTGDIAIDFYPKEHTWHYVDLDFLVDEIELGTNDGRNSSTSPPPLSTENPLPKNDLPVHSIDYSFAITYHNFDDQEVDQEFSADTESLSNVTNSDNSHEKYIPAIITNRVFDSYPLLRQTYREFFMFDYDLLPDINGTVPLSINMTSGVNTLMKFDVGEVYDIGGTLSFAIAMKYDISGNVIDTTPATATESKDSPNDVIAEKLVAEEVKCNQTVIVCMRLNEPGIPSWPDKCIYGRHQFPAASIINNTDSDSGTGLIHVPFPESGQWFVTFGLFCRGSETTTARTTIIDSVKNFIRHNSQQLQNMKAPCSCAADLNLNYYRECLASDKCLNQLNETETLKIKECLMDSKCTGTEHHELSKAFEIHHKYATEKSVNIGNSAAGHDGPCNTSIVFTISSSPCVAGRCGRNGRCYHYMSGQFVFSTCLCLKNYRGWDCSEDSQVPSSVSILVASLLLVLSNLLFIPSIYFAVRREYYTEAVIYFFAMFFSTFYHACDSGEEEFSFCLVKISVLQFCDFYCGLLAIWVTLIAMAHIRPTLVSLLHMLGAILLAFGTELNKQSLWVFLAPALTGICIISVSWGLKCRKTKKLFPSKKYVAIFLPIGSILVMVGLICYAFLQTKQNYHIVHSVWHVVMALSILSLLPNRKSLKPKC